MKLKTLLEIWQCFFGDCLEKLSNELESGCLYSMKIKEQTRKLATGCSKHCFEVVDRTDEVSSKHGFEVVDEATLTWFEEIFEKY